MSRRRGFAKQAALGPAAAAESRVLLSSQVQASIVEGSLVITGDDQNNKVTVRLDGETSEIVVAAADAETLVNSGAEARFSAADVTGGMKVDLGEGDDQLTIGGEDEEPDPAIASAESEEEDEARLTIPGNVEVQMGAGNDGVKASFVNINGSVSIDTGDGENTVDLGRGPKFGEDDHEETTLSASITPSAEEGGGDEGGGPPSDLVIGKGLTVTGGTGSDKIKLAFAKVGGNVNVNTSSGDDYFVTGRGPIRGEHGEGEDEGSVSSSLAAAEEEGGQPKDVHIAGSLKVLAGAGSDNVVIRNTEVQSLLTINADGGHDNVGVQRTAVAGTVSLSLGTGDDDLALKDNAFKGKATLSLGGGKNRAGLIDTIIDKNLSVSDLAGASTVVLDGIQVKGDASVKLDGGNDALAVLNSHFTKKTTFHGGTGQDTRFLKDNTGTAPTLNSFELAPATFDSKGILNDILGEFEGYWMGDA